VFTPSGRLRDNLIGAAETATTAIRKSA